jgi:hypothetical protein
MFERDHNLSNVLWVKVVGFHCARMAEGHTICQNM